MGTNMSFKLFPLVCLVTGIVCEEITKKSDSDISRTDFVPQFQPFQFPGQPFGGPHDLTPLQQTHVLGSFHHRFHPTRLSPQFGNPPLVFGPQAHILPPRPLQDQRSLQQQGLVPPQQPHDVLHPPILQQSSQPTVLSPQNQQAFKHPSNQKQTNAFDQSIKNSFPSNAPHTIKFSISSQNYNPNQNKHFVNPSTPQPKINHQTVSQSRFVSQPVANQVTNLRQQTFFNDPSKIQQTSFQSFNLKKPEIQSSQNGVNFNVQPSFGPTSAPVDLSSQYRVNIVHSNQNIRQQSNDPSTGNVEVRPTESHNKFAQSGFNFRQNEGQQQAKFNQEFVRTNFEITPSQQPSHIVQSLQQTGFQVQTEQHFNVQPSQQTNFEFQSSEQPQYSINQESGRVTTSSERGPLFQKTQAEYNIGGNYNTEAFASPTTTATTTTETFATTVSSRYRGKPKPVVKEITINLNDKKVPGNDIPAQLYIKEDRQKELAEIAGQEPTAKPEKSQEDVINEQIQKLLQSHNLEIIDKENDSQSESQEAQLKQFSEQFKKKYNYSVQLLNGGSLLRELKPKKKTVVTTLPPLPDLPEHIKKQYDIKLVHRDELFKQFDLPGNHKLGNDTSNVFLANGQQLELVKFTKDGIMDKIAITGPTTTAKPPKVLFEELTKGVIPPGADFELIKHTGDGEVEKVNDLTNAKKVTFVFLEEQPDGSVKVQGVKGNGNQETEGGETVDSLIKKIKDGSLKLPPSKKTEGKSLITNEIPRINPVTHKSYATFSSPVATTPTTRSVHNFPTTAAPFYVGKDTTERGPSTEFYTSPYAVDVDATHSPSIFYDATPETPTTFAPTINYIRTSGRKSKTKSRVTFLPTVSTHDVAFTPTFASKRLKTTTSGRTKTSSRYEEPVEYSESELLSHRSTEYGPRYRVPQDVIAEESSIDSVRPLNDILRENGLNEMAKFLDQSGLDTILNETGPYTIFIPTDKAFKTLQAQLGGADKAEDKFRENPRLLSGLLLHHVVPGSFRVEDLQDEMTGVSLAGTQLRVNTYSGVEDKESDAGGKIVTINGAKVSEDKKDLPVPQGVAHSVDRVLFPLPVGDILQTLRGDRERRFSKFLKSLESSGLTDMLTGTKTYTVFAPTDKAFAVLTDSELDKLLSRREAARTIVLRHIVPGTLYSAGMNYFQVKDSMEEGQKIIIKKELGKIKVNSAQITSANIPATNGVIHAVESLL